MSCWHSKNEPKIMKTIILKEKTLTKWTVWAQKANQKSSNCSFGKEKRWQNEFLAFKNESKIIESFIWKEKRCQNELLVFKKPNQKSSKRSFWKEKRWQNEVLEPKKRIKNHRIAHLERKDVGKMSFSDVLAPNLLFTLGVRYVLISMNHKS